MFFLKIERVNRNYNYFILLFLDNRCDLFDSVMPSLPILVVWKIIPAKLTRVFGWLARPLHNGIANLSLAGTPFLCLLTSVAGKSDCFHFGDSCTILIFPGIMPECQTIRRAAQVAKCGVQNLKCKIDPPTPY
jgi:hypothetical protein